MPDFSVRSNKTELLDNSSMPFEDIKRNMEELNTINTFLGGHAITLNGFKEILGHRTTISVCEIGCGGGDNLFVIYNYCKKKSIDVTLIGIDINAHCIAFAKQRYGHLGMQFICSSYQSSDLKPVPDIIFSSLFCHHFNQDELIYMLQWMQQHCQLGFFINDLHRHPLAWWSIKMLTGIFSKSYMVKNDAPLSVLRGFKKTEWLQLLQKAELNANINWKWAFRHLIVYHK